MVRITWSRCSLKLPRSVAIAAKLDQLSRLGHLELDKQASDLRVLQAGPKSDDVRWSAGKIFYHTPLAHMLHVWNV